MSDSATHGHCPRCNSFQPVVWRPIAVWQPGVKTGSEFEGLEMVCRACDFLITKVGTLRKTIGMAPHAVITDDQGNPLPSEVQERM